MIDFSTTRLTIPLAFYCLVGYLAVFVLFKNYALSLKLSKFKDKTQWIIMFTSILVLSVTCFVAGDFYNYMDWIYDYKYGGHNHGEPIYETIIRILDKNYLIFRILIWGGGLLLIKNACDRLKIDKVSAIFILFAVYYMVFSYARASFAMAMYFWGLSFLICERRTRNRLILGIFGILLSYTFHHTMLLCILITPLSMVPLRKRTITYLVVLCPIICYIIGIIFADVFSQLPMMIEDEYISNKLTAVGNRADEASNWKGMMSNAFNYARFLLPTYIALRLVYFKNVYQNSIPVSINVLSIVSFYLILIAVSTLLIGLDNNLLYARISYMTHIPLSLIMAKLYQDGKISKRKMSALIVFLFVCSMYRLLYAVYSTVSR